MAKVIQYCGGYKSLGFRIFVKYHLTTCNYMTKKHSIHAISPIDGRYYNKVQVLSKYFSEYALIKYRVKVEIECYHSVVIGGDG